MYENIILFRFNAWNLINVFLLIYRHSFGEQFSTKKWAKEISGQREILSAYGGVRMEDVRGMRAPFLAVSSNVVITDLYMVFLSTILNISQLRYFFDKSSAIYSYFFII